MTRSGVLAPGTMSGVCEPVYTRKALSPVGFDAARERAHAVAAPLPPRRVPLPDTAGAVLAAPLAADEPVPATDRSAMDGYAVRGPGPWTVVGTLAVDAVPGAHLEPGQACAVVTGTAIPDGTDAVLRSEDAIRHGDRLTGATGPATHIRRTGEECRAGTELLPAGAVVRPQVLGLAAALGHDRLLVHPVPRVAAFVSGDELVGSGRPGPGRVRDAIGPMLPGLITAAGGRPGTPVWLPDNRAALSAALTDTDADLLLVSGSSAAGPADHLRAALAEVGAELVIDGVTCRPGHPQALAVLPDGRIVVGLPGNPLAALAAFVTIGRAALSGLRGEPLPPLLAAPVPGGMRRHPVRTRLVPVRVRVNGIEEVGHGGAGMLRGAALADALAVVDPGRADAIAARLLPLTCGVGTWEG